MVPLRAKWSPSLRLVEWANGVQPARHAFMVFAQGAGLLDSNQASHPEALLLPTGMWLSAEPENLGPGLSSPAPGFEHDDDHDLEPFSWLISDAEHPAQPSAADQAADAAAAAAAKRRLFSLLTQLFGAHLVLPNPQRGTPKRTREQRSCCTATAASSSRENVHR